MENKLNINYRTKDLVTSSMLIALVFVATYIHVPSPFSLNSGGLIHLGNIMLFVASIVFGKYQGAIAGSFGMGLFDLFSGYAVWAPFTFIIRGVMGFVIGYFAHSKNRNGNNLMWNIVGLVIASVWMVLGYFMTNIVLYHNIAAAISSVPGDLTQLAFGFIAGIPLAAAVKQTKALKKDK